MYSCNAISWMEIGNYIQSVINIIIFQNIEMTDTWELTMIDISK